MRHNAALVAVAIFAIAASVQGGARDAGASEAATSDPWAGYLDYAYIYSSAESDALMRRLRGYGREAGISLGDYIVQRFESGSAQAVPFDERDARHEAVAYLLRYISEGDRDALHKSVAAVRRLEGNLGRHENRYWYHYILAHQTLERGHAADFVGETLRLWLQVVVPLETPYETLHALSLSDSPNSGFSSALPYILENVSRLILVRSQQMGLDRELDPLAALVRLLNDGRVGWHSDVIPPEASSREYLDRIVARLDGPESDAGSLTFTLSLFEASKYHDRSRNLLASQGLSDETLKAIRVTSGAYEAALNRAKTVQGECAVYTRVLRQLGEVYAAKQRLGVNPDIESPFSIEDAIEVYSVLHKEGRKDWAALGYRRTGRESYVEAMHGLWAEIQEASLNAADYYLQRSTENPARADEHVRNAARIYSRYLALFQQFATSEGKHGVPDSAYFAAYEAARGFGEAFLIYAANPSPAEMRLAVRQYLIAMNLYPFERSLWSTLTAALERHGRENDYLPLARPVAERVARSRHLNSWLENDEPGSREIAPMRRALSDSLAIMFLGFAEASGTEDLERKLAELRVKRGHVESEIAALSKRREELNGIRVVPAAPAAPEGMDAATTTAAQRPRLATLELSRLNEEISRKSVMLSDLDKRVAARQRAVSLYEPTLRMGDLAGQLRSQREHPAHRLLRRMYHENRS